MKIRRLKEIVNALDDEMEVFASPLEDMEQSGKTLSRPARVLSLSPLNRYEVTIALKAGGLGENGVRRFYLLLGYDDRVNHGTTEMDAVSELVN